MTFIIELSQRAEADIENAYNYIAKDSQGEALNWRFGVEERVRSLSMFPERCGFAPEHYYSTTEIRQTLYGKYRILFTMRRQTVYILTVRHGARQFLQEGEMDRLSSC